MYIQKKNRALLYLNNEYVEDNGQFIIISALYIKDETDFKNFN